MGAMRFDRDPAGKFMMPSEALRHWLPELLENALYGTPFETLLTGAMTWCDRRAGRNYQRASRALEGLDEFQNPQLRAEICVREAAKWFEYKRILGEALARIKAVR